MSKILITCAALAIAAMVALPAPAGAAQRNAAGIKAADVPDIGAARKHKRQTVRVTVRPRWRGPDHGRDYFADRSGSHYPAQYRPHPYDLYVQSRPYFVPGGPPVGNAPYGAGTGAYGFGYQ
jgi:hypothetical protein